MERDFKRDSGNAFFVLFFLDNLGVLSKFVRDPNTELRLPEILSALDLLRNGLWGRFSSGSESFSSLSSYTWTIRGAHAMPCLGR